VYPRGGFWIWPYCGFRGWGLSPLDTQGYNIGFRPSVNILPFESSLTPNNDLLI
jgi:hypothetical protein